MPGKAQASMFGRHRRGGPGWAAERLIAGNLPVRWHRSGVEELCAPRGEPRKVAGDGKTTEEHRQGGAFGKKSLHVPQVCAVTQHVRSGDGVLPVAFRVGRTGYAAAEK